MFRGRVYQFGEKVGESGAIYIKEAGFSENTKKPARLIECRCSVVGCDNTFIARENLLYHGRRSGCCDKHKGFHRQYREGDFVGQNGAIYVKDIDLVNGIRYIECICANPSCDNHFISSEGNLHSGFFKGYCEECRKIVGGLHQRKERIVNAPISDELNAPIFLGYEEYEEDNKQHLKGRFLCSCCRKNEFIRTLDQVEGKHKRWLCNECSIRQQIKKQREKSGLLPGHIVNEGAQVLWIEELLQRGYERWGVFKNLITGVTFTAPLSAATTGNTIGADSRSLGEKVIAKILFDLNIDFIEQYSFNNLRSPKGVLLRFDFYLPKENVLIEYDGIQHFFPNKNFNNNNYEDWQYNRSLDRMKDQYCQDNNISLIRIPFWVFKKQELTPNYILDILDKRKERVEYGLCK